MRLEDVRTRLRAKGGGRTEANMHHGSEKRLWRKRCHQRIGGYLNVSSEAKVNQVATMHEQQVKKEVERWPI